MQNKIAIKKVGIDFNNYEKIHDMNLIQKLKKSEEQIKNGDVIDAGIVFKEMRTKYGY